MKNKLTLIFFLVFAVSCQKDNLQKAYHKQVVPKGWHYCKQPNKYTVKNSHTVSKGYRIMFDESMLYEVGKTNHWNKAIGWYFNFSRDNSTRLGWRPKNDSIEVCIYAYSDGKPLRDEWVHTMTLATNFGYDLNITKADKEITFTINGVELNTVELADVGGKWISHSNMYFGGEDEAPHKMMFFYKMKNN